MFAWERQCRGLAFSMYYYVTFIEGQCITVYLYQSYVRLDDSRNEGVSPSRVTLVGYLRYRPVMARVTSSVVNCFGSKKNPEKISMAPAQ